MSRKSLPNTVVAAFLLAFLAACNPTTPTPVPTTTPTPSPAASPMAFNVSLRGDQENPPVSTTATGSAQLTLNAQRTALTGTVSHSGLSGTFTGAHIHRGAVGENGPVVRALTFNGDQATVNWTTGDADQPLTAELVEDLLAGRLYVNVHSEKYPTGEIRAQLTR